MVNIWEYVKLFHSMGDGFLGWWYLFLIAACFAIALLGVYFVYRKVSEERLPQLFFLMVMLFGLLYSLVLPPLSAPDEVAHYIASYELSNRMLGLTPLRDSEGRIRIRTEDVFIDDWTGDGDLDNATVVGKRLTRELYQELHERGLMKSGEEGYSYSLQEPVKTTPCAYIIPALGFSIARILGLGGFGLLYLGRWMNLLFFSLLGGLSIKRLPFGKYLLFSISLFPMLLELAASLSYDCFILGLSFYLIGTVLDLSFRKSRVSFGDILTLMLLALLLSPCKLVYSFLFLLCFMIPSEKFGSKGRYLRSILLVGICMLGSVLLVNRSILMLYLLPGEEAVSTVDWMEGTEALKTYQLSELVKSPGTLLSLLGNTFREKGGFYLESMAGGMLGHLEEGLGFSDFFLWILYGIPLFLSLFGEREPFRLRIGKRLGFLGTGVLVSLLLILSMLSAYTPEGASCAEGIQGRYFLPLLPLIFLALHGNLLAFLQRKTRLPHPTSALIQRLPLGLLYLESLLDLGLLLYLFRNISLRTW